MNDHVTINDAAAKPASTSDSVNIQDSASQAYTTQGQADFLKASASGRDSASALLPGLSIGGDSGERQYLNPSDDPYLQQALATIFGQSIPKNVSSESCIWGVPLTEDEVQISPHATVQERASANAINQSIQAQRQINYVQQNQNRAAA